MKKILIAATLVGAAGAGLFMYMRQRNQGGKIMDDMNGLADKATQKLKKHWRKITQTADELQTSNNSTDNTYNHSMS
ncbi:hypothetical protein SAMN05660909_01425 [Chitinophaga terrae (ex Kim and Jung 2007)]|uniref:Uncharacterized protein n=1 Tax=Chitinophaga terrae (ex Kim and Jung 2007) TaxID=408074 RepID=A0A1H4A1Z9_9BACT|nr:hypothetical protein [Chitinophaga terrae (ex Kim and Jung 2007)]MDQ0106069.1 hypothetical protein [Chitinophaga terrae (ex Kim and Jung 2007)]GEP90007.1 hypothetical protein CTE07_16520 [Chitinophaga terrae (ex Kim and Jung 2007)]SEA30015.1 hypothetical protein SAMN05660909_01425 [Chitinophaga terrae (ex Kim and Jung 2007)]